MSSVKGSLKCRVGEAQGFSAGIWPVNVVRILLDSNQARQRHCQRWRCQFAAVQLAAAVRGGGKIAPCSRCGCVFERRLKLRSCQRRGCLCKTATPGSNVAKGSADHVWPFSPAGNLASAVTAFCDLRAFSMPAPMMYLHSAQRDRDSLLCRTRSVSQSVMQN